MMENSMWKVDRRHGSRFCDPRALDQLPLFLGEDADLRLLRTALLTRSATGPVVAQELRSLHRITVYREKGAYGVARASAAKSEGKSSQEDPNDA